MQRSVVLLAAVLASIATSRYEPDDEPSPGATWTRVVLTTEATYEVPLTIAFAVEPDCALLEQAPWLAPSLVFGESDAVVLDGAPLPLRAESPDDVEPLDCYVARVRRNDTESFVWVGPDRVVSELSDSSLPRIVVHPEGPSVFVDGGEDLLYEAVDLDVCERPLLPEWGLLEAEGTLRHVERGADCSWLTVDDTELEVCGIELPVLESGAPVRIHADARVLDIDVFGGPRVVAGEGLDRLLLQPLVLEGELACARTDACGATTEGVLDLDDVQWLPGDQLEYDGGRLTVLDVRHPLQQGCAPSASILYVRP